MLNEEKIKLMTKMAAFEQGEGKKYIPMIQYYRKDFISLQMIKTFVYSTFAFGILFLLWFLYKIDYYMENIHKLDLMNIGTSFLFCYVIFIVVYLIISCIIFNIQYAKGKRHIRRYQYQLKQVMRIYKKGDKTQSLEERNFQ